MSEAEARDLLLGLGAFARPGAPERLLLVALAPFLPEALLPAAVEAGRAASDPAVRARALAALAARRQDLSGEAIAATRSIADPARRLRALTLLATTTSQAVAAQGQRALLHMLPGLEDRERAQALLDLAPSVGPDLAGAALEAALSLRPGSPERGRALDALAARSPDAAAVAVEEALRELEPWALGFRLRRLAPHLPGDLLARALAGAAAAHPADRRAAALAALAPDLPERLVGEAVTAAEGLGADPALRSQVMAALAPRLARAGEPERALREVARIGMGRPRAEALAGLAAHLPASLWDSALDVAAGIPGPAERATALAGLAAALEGDHLERAVVGALDALAAGIAQRRADPRPLRGLAPRVPDRLLDRALELTGVLRRHGYVLDEVAFLSDLAGERAEARRRSLLAEALRSARAGGEPLVRAPALVALAAAAWDELDGSRLLWEARALVRASAASAAGRGQLLEQLALRLAPWQRAHLLGDPWTLPDRSPRGLDGIFGSWLAEVLAGLAEARRDPLLAEAVARMQGSPEEPTRVGPLPDFPVFAGHGDMSRMPMADWFHAWLPGGKGPAPSAPAPPAPAPPAPPAPPPPAPASARAPEAAPEPPGLTVRGRLGRMLSRGRPEPPPRDLEYARAPGDHAEAEAVEAAPRKVSAGFSAAAAPGVELDPRSTLAAAADHYLWLEVGEDVARRSILGALAELPAGLPARARLTVRLFEFPGELEVRSPPIAELELQDGGPAQVIRPSVLPAALPVDSELVFRRLFFLVRTPAPGAARLRFSLYLGSTVLQSWLVEAEVTGAELVREAPALRATLAYTLSSSLAPALLEPLPGHEVSLLVSSGHPDGLRFDFAGDRDFTLSVGQDTAELTAFVRDARQSLRRAAWGDGAPWSPDRAFRYAGDPGPHALRDDLVMLAIHGYRLYVGMVTELGLGPGRREELERRLRLPGRLQVALERSARYALPAAIVYDRRFDTAAAAGAYRLCPAFEQALDTQAPLDGLPCFAGDCPAQGQPTSVCPSGFWGFRHAIGLPLSVRDGEDLVGELPRAGLQLAAGFATDLELLAEHEQALGRLRPGLTLRRARSRAETLDLLRAGEAQVVYFYCHGGVENGTAYIRVGGGDERGITMDNLDYERILWERSRPLVFINGCQTAALDPEAVFNLVDGFVSLANAAGVVGTEITVFEEMAAPFAVACLGRFLGEPPQALGDAVRGARLELLRRGNPLGLAYVPFVLSGLRLAPA